MRVSARGKIENLLKKERVHHLKRENEEHE